MFLKLKNLYQHKLSIKFLSITCLIMGAGFLFLFFWLSDQLEEHIMEQVRQQAIILYKQIVLTREWVADHNTVLFSKPDLSESAHSMDNPSSPPDSYLKLSPSVVTRMLSERAKKGGLYYFRLANTETVNPENTADDLENEALKAFRENGSSGVFRKEKHENETYMRYIAPVYVTENCIQCHQRQYYQPGEVGGCLSIFIPMNQAQSAVFRNRLVLIGGMSGFALSLMGMLFLGTRSLVFNRIEDIKSAMGRISAGEKLQSSDEGDELKSIADFCYILDEQLQQRHFDLEKKITEATKDLSTTNNDLAHAIQELENLNKAKSDFFSDISHELRTPLTSIKGAIDILQRKGSCEHPEYLDIIKRNTEQLIKTVLDFLDYSKIESGQLELDLGVVDICSLFREVVLSQKAVAEKKDVTIHLVCSREIEVELDEKRIFQVCGNLLENAINFSPNQSRIICEIKKESNNEIRVSVADHGPGIDDKFHDQIFKRFYQVSEHKSLHKGSSGIGLAICKGIVEAHHGYITVSSAVDKGAVFSFVIPIQQNSELKRPK